MLDLIESLQTEYRKKLTTLMKLQLRNHSTPSRELAKECTTLEGCLNGIKISLNVINKYLNEPEFTFGDPRDRD